MKDNNRGVTLVVLIITVIVMLILASTAVTMSLDSIEHSKMMRFVTYMQEIQKKVDLIAEYEDYSQYEDLSEEEKSTLEDILSSSNETFVTTSADDEGLKYFDTETLESELELEGIEDQIVVNFKTREVISLEGIKYDGNMYYTQYNLPNGQKIKTYENIERNVTFEDVTVTIDGINATFTIKNVGITNGTLSYGRVIDENNIKWTVITNNTKKNEDVTTQAITMSGTYYFKLVDNTTGKEYKTDEDKYPELTIKLANAPKERSEITNITKTYNYSNLKKSEDWAYAEGTDGTTTYVWIPRFAYKTNDTTNIEFLKGVSEITTTGKYIKPTEWTVPDAFTTDSEELTGVWVKVSKYPIQNLDIIDVLSGTILK